MRSVLHLLLCGYMLLLSVLPCADGFAELRPDGTQTTVSTDTHPHTDHHADGDFCSPFCVCSCCGTVLDTLPHFQFAYLTVGRIDCFALLKTEHLAPTLPSWQPPRIG